MQSDLYGSNDVDVVLRAWVYRKVEQGLPRGDEILFDHAGVMRLMFRPSSYEFLTVYHNGQSNNEISMQMPRGRWMWVVAWHTQTKSGLQIQDQKGIVYSSGFDTNPTTNSRYTDRRVTIGNNFNGHILGMKYYK